MMWVLFTLLSLSEVHAEPSELALTGADRMRIRDLIDDTQEMPKEQRATYLLALVNAAREAGPVQEALQRALVVTEDGRTYEDALRAAIGDEKTMSAAPEADTELSAEALRSMRQYRSKHLELRSEIRQSSTPTYYPSPFGLGVGNTPWGGSWGTGGWSRSPGRTTQGWTVYQGALRLDVPAFLSLTGQKDLATNLNGRIERKKLLSRTYYGIGMLGLVAMVSGYVGVVNTEDPVKKEQWGTVGSVGLGATVVGLIGGGIPNSSANRLRYDYDRATDAVAAQQNVDDYNEQLRKELCLTPTQALDVERNNQNNNRFR